MKILFLLSLLTNVVFYSPNTVRIVKGGPAPESSFAVTKTPEDVKVKQSSSKSKTVYLTSALKVVVDNESGSVQFYTASGKYLVKEGAFSMTERTEGADKGAYIVKQNFILGADEPVYGLGILQDGQLSLRGKSRHMVQDNTEDFVPVVQSVKGYGIFWDNPSITDFNDDAEGMSFTSEVGECADYYFIYGGNADGVVSGIRSLTGKVPMLPLWSYGFMQSRERYKSSSELLSVLGTYRQMGVPIDCMIQDWQYWGGNYNWNAMEFINENFKDAQAMIDEVHKNNAHMMISVWSSFGPATKAYKELEEKGLLLHFMTWPQSGLGFWPPRMDYPSGVFPYDPYSAEARDIYWNNLLRLENMGIDAWWMDSTEPDHKEITDNDYEIPTAMGSFRKVRNAFPIAAVNGVYEHQRVKTSDRRVCILTRSAYAGQQRTGANTWSGDTMSEWEVFRQQIPAGLGFAMTGNPDFNTDIGGFFAREYNGKSAAESAVYNPRFRELYVRWMQYGIFSPMMRSHGTEAPREIYLYGDPGQPVYDALVKAIKMRYSLMPYIYSTAWQVSAHDGTYQRALVMDFPSDRKVWNLNDEFMFGSAFLVAPVLHAQYTSEKTGFSSEHPDFSATGTRTVYLPEGASWYDYSTRQLYKGGRSVDVTTTLDTFPLFVRAGSIVPFGPDVQYTSEKPWDSLTVKVYSGADGSFTLYEDEGDNYNYENGSYTEIPFTLKGRRLVIGERKGSYAGMITSRKFNVVFVESGKETEKTVDYDGSEIKVEF